MKRERGPGAFPGQEPPTRAPPYRRALPTTWTAPTHGRPSHAPPHRMDHLSANGLLTAKAIEELCFLDSL